MIKIYNLKIFFSVIILLLLIKNANALAIKETNKIVRIKEFIKEIDFKKDKLTYDSTEIMNESTEGGIIVLHKDGQFVVKIECQFYGETGQASEIYYFSNQKLICYSYFYIKYKELGITEESEIEDQFKVIYYIENNEIIQKDYSDENIASKYEYRSKSYSQIQNNVDSYLNNFKRK